MKRKKMLKKIGILAVVASMLFGIFALVGCEQSVDEGYFRVRLNHSDGYAIIDGLTESGKEQEILAIPSHVRGLPVQRIGRRSEMTIAGMGGFNIRSENLKKIYIPYTVDSVISNPLPERVEVIFLPAISNIYLDFLRGGGRLIYMTNTYFDFINDRLRTDVFIANLTYRYNFVDAPNNDYFWIDNITGENLYIRPDNPSREGYKFTGWFLDSEGTIAWDGIHPASRDEVIELYAGWQKT